MAPASMIRIPSPGITAANIPATQEGIPARLMAANAREKLPLPLKTVAR